MCVCVHMWAHVCLYMLNLIIINQTSAARSHEPTNACSEAFIISCENILNIPAFFINCLLHTHILGLVSGFKMTQDQSRHFQLNLPNSF